MIIEILELASALEWIALGVLVFFQAAQPQTQIGSSAEGSGRLYPLNAWPESPATL